MSIAERIVLGQELPPGRFVGDQFIPGEDLEAQAQVQAAAAALPLDPAEETRLRSELEAAQSGLWRARSMGDKAHWRGRIREINAQLAGGVEERATAKWLKQRAKQGKGEFVLEEFYRALPYLPGWQIEEDVPVDATVNENDFDAYLQEIKPEGLRIYVYSDGNHYVVQHAAIYNTPPAEHPKVLADLELLREQTHRGLSLNPKDMVGSLWATRVGPVEEQEGFRSVGWEFHVSKPVRTRTTGVRITAPNGVAETFTNLGDRVWTWSYKHGLHTSAAAMLSEAERAVPAPRQQATSDARTCPVCFRTVERVGNRRGMAQHGYSFPHHAYRQNDACEGSGYLAWEVSPKGTQDYIPRLYAALAEHKADVEAGPPKVFTYLQGRGEKAVIVSVREGEAGYSQLAERWIRGHEFKISQLESTNFPGIPWYEAAVAGWKPAAHRTGGPPFFFGA